MQREISKPFQNQANHNTKWISPGFAMSTSFITQIDRALLCGLRAAKASNSVVILARFNRVLALRETRHLWGGKLKRFETPTRNRIQLHCNLLTRPPRTLQHHSQHAAHCPYPIRNGEVRLCSWLGMKELIT